MKITCNRTEIETTNYVLVPGKYTCPGKIYVCSALSVNYDNTKTYPVIVETDEGYIYDVRTINWSMKKKMGYSIAEEKHTFSVNFSGTDENGYLKHDIKKLS